MPKVTSRKDKRQHWYCYTVACKSAANTYVGKTNNLKRRLRQHNGEIKGGARRTKGDKWFFAFYVKGFRNESHALKYEWRMHNPPKKRHYKDKSSIMRRICHMIDVMNLPRWTSSSPHSVDVPLTIVWMPLFKPTIDKLRHKFPRHIKHEFASTDDVGLEDQD